MMEPESLEASNGGVLVAKIEDGDSRIKGNDTERPEGTSYGGGGIEDKRPKEENGGFDHVVDIKNEEHLREEKICRICHLSSEPSSGSSELIQLGCRCREELGISHRHCAEAWFKQKGNRLCEICNKTAKNVRLMKDTRIYVMDFNEIRPMAATSFEYPIDGSQRCKQSCNFLLGFLILAFILSMFFRVNIF